MSLPTLYEAAAFAERARLESKAVLECQRNISGLVLDMTAQDMFETLLKARGVCEQIAMLVDRLRKLAPEPREEPVGF